MNERQIDPSEVRVGDRVRVSYEGFVTHAVEGMWVLDNSWQPDPEDGSTVTLLDRPLPPIPTDDGTIIQHRNDPFAVRKRKRGAWWSPLGRRADWTPDPCDWRVLVPADERTPTPAPERKIVALIDCDGDRWNADGDRWRYNKYVSLDRVNLNEKWGPLTEVHEDEK